MNLILFKRCHYAWSHGFCPIKRDKSFHVSRSILSPNVQHVSQTYFSCAAFYFGLARSNLSQHISQSYYSCAAFYSIWPSSLQLDSECSALFAELLYLRGIWLRSSSLTLKPECSALFAKLLQLRSFLLRSYHIASFTALKNRVLLHLASKDKIFRSWS